MSEDHIFIEVSGEIHEGKEEINWKDILEYFQVKKFTSMRELKEKR